VIVLAGLLALSAVLIAIPATAGPATTIIDFETAPNGSPTTSGQQLTAYPAQGVDFANGVEVVLCGATEGTNCLEARSGTRVVRTLLDGEFARHPFDASFADPKDTVTVYVRLDAGAGSNGSEVTVVMNAYDPSSAFIGSTTETFTHNATDGAWHEISMNSAPGLGGEPRRIGRVEVWGGETIHVGSPPVIGQATNFLLFDELTMQSPPDTTTTTAAVDDTPPQVAILRPSDGAVVTAPSGGDGVTPLRVRASDDSGQLDRVDLTIIDPTGGESTVNLCGRSPSPACSPASPSDPWETASTLEILLTEGEGRYTLTATACDLAGNCATSASVDVILSLDDAPAAVEALKVELNQGTQTVRGLLDIPGPGGTAPIVNLPRGTLIAGRDLVVRYYLVGIGGPRDGFSARLDVQVWQAGDSFPSAGRLFDPVGTADVPADPGDPAGRDDLVRQMRGDLTQTLDFVVPAELLEDAVTIDLALSGVGGHVQARVQPSVTLGLHTIALIARIDPDTMLVADDDLNAVLAHLRSALPISELLFPNIYDDRWDLDNGSIAPFIDRIGFYPDDDRSTECGSILDWVRTVYAGDTMPTTDAPDYVVTFGVAAGAWFDGACLGMGYLSGEPTAIAYADTNVAPQEIVHTMGVEHASNDHLEEDGGGFEAWPYPHGIISPDGFTVFGVITEEDGGSWDLTLVAPCLTDETDPASITIDCMTDTGDPVPDDQRMHDIMSYGPWMEWTQDYYPSPGGAFRWTSDITYGRVYGVLESGVLVPPTGELASFSSAAAGQGEARADAWIVSGVVREDGSVELFQNPVRKMLPSSMIGDGHGPYTLELLDESDAVLESESFDPSLIDHDSHVAQFWVAVPYVEGVDALRIQQDGTTIFELAASDNPPTVEVISPNGGEALRDGTLEVTWEASDDDGDDALTFLVQYSPDNGQSWQGVTLVEGPPYEAEVEVGELLPGQQALVRITASDGLNTAVDQSDGFFAVGPDAQAPESEDTGSGVGWWLIALVTLAGLVLGGGLVFGILRTRGRGATGS
jgi:hypothetical protein